MDALNHKNGISKTTLKHIALICLILLLSACGGHEGQRERTGRIVGAIVGGAIGEASGVNYPSTRILVGTVVGSKVGANVGRSMDKNARERARRRQYHQHHQHHHSKKNHNSKNNTRSRVYSRETYRRAHNSRCRRYEKIDLAHGRKYITRGTACLDANGHWRTVGQNKYAVVGSDPFEADE